MEKGGTTGLAWHLRFFSVCMYGETEYHTVDSIRFLRRPTWPRPRTAGATSQGLMIQTSFTLRRHMRRSCAWQPPQYGWLSCCVSLCRGLIRVGRWRWSGTSLSPASLSQLRGVHIQREFPSTRASAAQSLGHCPSRFVFGVARGALQSWICVGLTFRFPECERQYDHHH